MRATASPTSGPSTLSSLDYSGPLDQAGSRFASVARAFEVAREFSGRLDQAFDITTVSDFPHERGLGSSAAAAGAIIRAVLDACGREAGSDELFALTQLAEQIAHGKPSGLDAAAPTGPTQPYEITGAKGHSESACAAARKPLRCWSGRTCSPQEGPDTLDPIKGSVKPSYP